MQYELDQGKPAIVFEVMLPKRESYISKLKEVLDCFFNKDQLRVLPPIKAQLDKLGTDEAKEILIARLQDVISGYSIYEVDGRFATSDGPIDERTWVIRFIIHDPKEKGSMRGDIDSLARNVIIHLISKRFAEELGTEQEIWFLEYGHPMLQRWVKKADQ